MDKIISARIDVSAIQEMDRIAKRLGMTKKEFLESAIRLRARQLEDQESTDVWETTLGAWSRKETPDASIAKARRAFRAGFERHHGSERRG